MLVRHRACHRFITATTLLFIGEMVAVHLIYSDRTFNTNPLSIYALGPYWYLITSGFIFCAINYALLAGLFWSVGARECRRFRWGVFALLFLSFDTLIIAAFPADFGPVVSVRGWIHEVAAYLHFTVLPVACLGLSCGLRHPTFARHNRIAAAFALLLVAIGLAIVWDTWLRTDDHYYGVLQKTLIFVIQLWVLYASWKLATEIENGQRIPDSGFRIPD